MAKVSNVKIRNVDIGGAEFYVSGRYLGLTRGDCTASWETETVPVYQGVPRKLQGEIIRQRSGSIALECLELTAENYELASGDGVIATEQETEEKTVAAESVKLVGTTPVALANTYVNTTTGFSVKSSDGLVTYVKDTDYTVATDNATHKTTITRVAAGSIADGATVKVGYTYTAYLVTEHLLFGASSELNEIENIVIHKKNDRNGKHLIIQAWKAQNSGALNFVWNEEASDVLGINLNFSINDDSDNHPQSPMGLITWAPKFDINDLPTEPAEA